MAVDCKACGFCYEKNGSPMCFQRKEKLESMEQEECSIFYKMQYDGDEAYSPEQHLFLYENDLEHKKMGHMQGMRF